MSVYAATQGGESDQVVPTTLTYFNISAQQMPLTPFSVGICFYVRHRPLELGFTSISLLYGMKFPLSFI